MQLINKLLLLFMFSGVGTMQSEVITTVPDGGEIARAVIVTYTNWRGETAQRTIIPITVHWGKTEWHPHEQWLLKVWDIERQAYRDYALKDIKNWTPKQVE